MNDSKDHKAAAEPPLDCDVRPCAWMRRWYFDREKPHKERNANGRMAWPIRFKWLPVTPNRILDDDVPLYAKDERPNAALNRTDKA